MPPLPFLRLKLRKAKYKKATLTTRIILITSGGSPLSAAKQGRTHIFEKQFSILETKIGCDRQLN